ncbi:MAG: hypothetical protein AB7G47_19660 [Mycolicibacterium sp.]
MHTDPWFADHSTVVSLAHVLVATDTLSSPTDVIDYFEKPHRYTSEYQIWHSCGRPSTQHPQWAVFADLLDAHHDGRPPVTALR